MPVGYEPQWIRKWRKRTQGNNTCDIKTNIWPEFQCTQWILFSNINVMMCYNHRQCNHLGKVTKEHLESEFLFLSCVYLSNPTAPISIYEGWGERWKKTYALLKPQLVKAKKVQQGASLRKKKHEELKWQILQWISLSPYSTMKSVTSVEARQLFSFVTKEMVSPSSWALCPKYQLVTLLVRMRFFLLYFVSQSAFSELQVEIWMLQQ